MRVAFYHTELERDGPGLFLRDIQRDKDPAIVAAARVIAQTRADVILLQGIDWDFDGLALTAFAELVATQGWDMPYRFSARPNRGLATSLDLNRNGRLGESEDAQSFGTFTGQNGLAVLSRFPIGPVQDFTDMLWRDLPGALLPYDGLTEQVAAQQRLSTTAHWLVPVETEAQGTLWLGAYAAGAPVFDGPEDRNGRRNHDETRFWNLLLDGDLPMSPPDGLVVAGNANLDPNRGDGRRKAIIDLLAHPKLQDPAPKGAGGDRTVDWRRDDLENMRIHYVLPSVDWHINDTGIVWPNPEDEAAEMVETASRHRLVWVDITRR